MAVWWLKGAEELEALRKSGNPEPAKVIPDVFSRQGGPKVIETTHRDITPRPAVRPRPEPHESHLPPRPHPADNGAAESFLKRGVKRSGRYS